MENIYVAINQIMKETPAIAKNKSSSQGYTYRGVDQVLNALQDLLSKYGVFIVPTVLEETRENRKTSKGGDVIYTIMKIKYTFYATDGSFVESVVVGEAMDSGDKSSNKCMSVAFKYACFQVLCIPTEETTQDPDDSCEKLVEKEKEYFCEECGAKFEAMTVTKDDGTTKVCDAKTCYDTSKAKNGKALCVECSKKHKINELEKELETKGVTKGINKVKEN